MSNEIDLYDVKHLKLTTGEEVLCEILEENDYDLVIRRALRLHTEVNEKRQRFHSFRPFMTYQDDPDVYTLVKAIHVVAVTFPAPAMIKQYQYSIMEVENLRDEMEEKSDDELEKIMKQMEDNVKDNRDLTDSDGSNVLPFPTVH
jgi:hypothetical protein